MDLYGRRAVVARPLNPVWPQWGVARPLGLVWLPWGRGPSPGLRKAAVGAWLVYWLPYVRRGGLSRPLGPYARRGGVARSLGPVWPP